MSDGLVSAFRLIRVGRSEATCSLHFTKYPETSVINQKPTGPSHAIEKFSVDYSEVGQGHQGDSCKDSVDHQSHSAGCRHGRTAVSSYIDCS